MHIDPLIASASDAFEIVSLKNFAASLFPFSDIRRHYAAAPEVALRARLSCRLFGPITLITAKFFRRPFEAFKRRSANSAFASFFSAFSPSGPKVTFGRTIFSVSFCERAGRTIERHPAKSALAIFTVLMPVERSARLPLIPSDSNQVSLSAIGAAIDAATFSARNWGAAAFAWMWFCSHIPIIAQYAEMAVNRIRGDAPLFAEVAAE